MVPTDKGQSFKAFKGAIFALSLVTLTAGCAATAETATVVPTPKPASAPQIATAPSAQAGPVEIDRADFQRWLITLRQDAVADGISPATVQVALGSVQPVPRVLELDRRQPEFSRTFGSYLSGAVSERRVRDGQAMLVRHRALLEHVAQKYGVQPRFLVAFWGLETNYGSNFGGFSVVEALATLAYDPRRATFFRRELMNALHIIDQGHIAANAMVGSWAGAMGNLQFMPSTFRAHAVDEDADGHADIWGSLPDTFASAAKYLADEGWQGDQTWGREVTLPAGFDYIQADLTIRKPLSAWAALGVRAADGSPLPQVDGMDGSIVIPAGAQGPAFIVYQNFRTTMVWNRSISYALAIGYLADRLEGAPPLVHMPSTSEEPLRRADVMEMQERLNSLGFSVGTADGMAGSRTRAAIRDFQQARGLIPDAYPSHTVLAALRSAENR
jgi:membrane-bound lytic murein transglycosylase B